MLLRLLLYVSASHRKWVTIHSDAWLCSIYQERNLIHNERIYYIPQEKWSASHACFDLRQHGYTMLFNDSYFKLQFVFKILVNNTGGHIRCSAAEVQVQYKSEDSPINDIVYDSMYNNLLKRGQSTSETDPIAINVAKRNIAERHSLTRNPKRKWLKNWECFRTYLSQEEYLIEDFQYYYTEIIAIKQLRTSMTFS